MTKLTRILLGAGAVLCLGLPQAHAAVSVDTAQGKIEIIGTGIASRQPEYASMSVNVTSVCYEKSMEAKNANAVLANKVVQVLERYKKGKRSRVIATGGPNTRSTEYVRLGEKSKVLCENKWRATNHLELRTEDMSSLAQLQDDLLALGGSGINPSMISQTYAELSQPSFGLHPDTMVTLRTEAQKKAWEDAKVQFENFKSLCGLKNPHLTEVNRPEYKVNPVFAAPAMKGSGEPTPIIPDELSVNATWKFVWSFDPTDSCALP